jgi:hypothetical protein
MRPRHWCARCRFGTRRDFLLGTVTADTEEAARALLVSLADSLFPEQPDILAVLPGQLVWEPGE